MPCLSTAQNPQTKCDEGEHGTQGVAAALATAGIGHLEEGAEQGAGVFGEGLEPEFFRAVVGQVVVGVVLGEAFGLARAGPVGDFVKGAVRRVAVGFIFMARLNQHFCALLFSLKFFLEKISHGRDQAKRPTQ